MEDKIEQKQTTTQLYDSLISVAVINLFTLGKENKKLHFINFNINDERHLAILKIARTLYDLEGFSITVNLNLIDYIILIKKLKCKYWVKRNHKKAGIDTEDFVMHIEKANDAYGIFKHIYKKYYERKN